MRQRLLRWNRVRVIPRRTDPEQEGLAHCRNATFLKCRDKMENGPLDAALFLCLAAICSLEDAGQRAEMLEIDFLGA